MEVWRSHPERAYRLRRSKMRDHGSQPAARRSAVAVLALLAAAFVAPLAAAAPPKARLSTPTVTCAGATQVSIAVQVCAGATGASGGFSLQWVPAGVLAGTDGAWPSSDHSAYCDASFSGNARNSRYALGPDQCVIVQVGDFLFDNGASTDCALPLVCGTEYAFRAFAHAADGLLRSDFTSPTSCSTLACGHGESCTFTQGYWKTHGPIPTGNNVNEWPVTSLSLGDVVYTDLELQAIFDTPAGGNGLVALAHQLIAAKLNVANGADPAAALVPIAAADALIGSLVVPPVGSGSLPSSQTSALVGALADYNEGATGPGHCG
jgi:hypothetical protein